MHTSQQETLATITTTELLAELQSRYNEAIFIGTGHKVTINGATTIMPAVDVSSTLHKRTEMHGTLHTILQKLLTKLTPKQPAANTTHHTPTHLMSAS